MARIALECPDMDGAATGMEPQHLATGAQGTVQAGAGNLSHHPNGQITGDGAAGSGGIDLEIGRAVQLRLD